MENNEVRALADAVHEMRATLFAFEFAVEQLMAEHPDPVRLLRHWDERAAAMTENVLAMPSAGPQSIFRTSLFGQMGRFRRTIEALALQQQNPQSPDA